MLRPETALSSWREWDICLNTPPVLVSPLGGGRSNRSFLLESGSKKMVLRINAPATVLPNPDRAVETRVWRAASDAGIAPQLLYTDPGDAFQVSAYIESSLPDRPQDNPALTAKALELLQRTHQLDIHAPAIDYAAHIERYCQIIGDKGLTAHSTLLERRQAMHGLVQDIINCDTPTGLCHHDPVIENFVGTPERLYLIDWEYAAHGLRVMDYAAFAVEWGLDNAAIATLSGFDAELLSMAREVYRYQCRLWDAVIHHSRL